ncbi:MAG: hypothetical protein OHK0039_38650 [Bacteroidia bacterium]
MKLEQTILTLAGVAGIAAAFLPFVHYEPQMLGVQLGETQVSGYTFVRALLDEFGVLPFEEGRVAMEAFQQGWSHAGGIKGYAQLSGLVLILAAPLIFVLYSIGYVVRGLAGKQYKRGIWFNLVFPGLAWAILYWISKDHSVTILNQEIGLKLNFFSMAGLGYWVAFGAMMAAAFSLFFEKSKG